MEFVKWLMDIYSAKIGCLWLVFEPTCREARENAHIIGFKVAIHQFGLSSLT